MFPSVRNAARTTLCFLHAMRCTRRLHTPGLVATASICSLPIPSVRWLSAQHASWNTSSSSWLIRCASEGTTACVMRSGEDLQKLEIAHVAWRIIDVEGDTENCDIKASTVPIEIRKSRNSAQSPAMLLIAHTHCSRSSSLSSSLAMMPTRTCAAPCSRIIRVCSLLPEVMFVMTQADSTCTLGFESSWSWSTTHGTAPASMISLIGGSLRLESSFRKDFVAASFTSAPLSGEAMVFIHCTI
mmetsp:Transcript_4808/g.8285  ORF Transcript_4808/g.8285 Transcript_4808/m.8285 type:complete len:242 (-) Transcript_4808:819-1544(-)